MGRRGFELKDTGLMNLTHYVRILIRRGWIVVLAIVLTAAAAFAFSKAQTPTYRATQKVLFQPARNDFGLTETLRTLLRSYVVYMNSDDQAAKVIDRLQLDMAPGELRSRTTIASDPTQLVIQFDVDMKMGRWLRGSPPSWATCLWNIKPKAIAACSVKIGLTRFGLTRPLGGSIPLTQESM
jgi:hypothetical protein